MKLRTLLILAVGLLLAAEAPKEDPGKLDKDKLQGRWKLVSVEFNGQQMAMDDLKESHLTVKGDDYGFTLAKMNLEWTFKIDPSKNPKEIDLTVVAGTDKGETYRGIYVLEGDTYKICRSIQPDGARPTQFSTKPDSGLILVIWQREKP